jgi:cobalt-zinc-cadmium efflux system outer membrane protein
VRWRGVPGAALALGLATTPAQATPPTLDGPALAALIERLAALPSMPALPLGGEAPLTLAAVLESVTVHHPQLHAARARARGAEGSRTRAAGAFDPGVAMKAIAKTEGYYAQELLRVELEQATPLWGASLFGGWRLGSGDVADYDGDLRTLEGGEFSAGVRVPLWRDGPIDKRRAALAKAEQALAAAGAEVKLEQLAVSLEAAEAYWKWVAAGRTYAVARDLLALATDRDGLLARQVAAGAIPAIERAENLRALLGRRDELVEARRGLEQAALKLSLYLRDDGGAPRVPPSAWLPAAMGEPEVPAPRELEDGLARALGGRPDLEALEARLAAAEIELDRARNAVAPKVEFELAGQKDIGSRVTVDPSKTENEDLAKTLAPAELKLGVSIELPLLLREAQGERTEAEAKVAESRAKLGLSRDKLEAEVRDLFSALSAAAERATLGARAAEAADAVAAGERARFESGGTSLFLVNLREQTAGDAARKAVKASAEYQALRAAWGLATLSR